jgi:hypothetical protein
MSPAPDPRLEELQQRYAAIEQVYAAQDWPEVEARCRSLLAEIPDLPSDPLRQRVLLLLAHTQLYGSGDPAGAASLYRAVLAAEAETVLADMARQGLARCGEPCRQPEPPGDEPVGADAGEGMVPGQAVAVWYGASSEPAMPWLQELSSTGIAQVKPVEPAVLRAPFQEPAPGSSPDQQTLGMDPGVPGWTLRRSADSAVLPGLRSSAEPETTTEPVDVVAEPEQIDLALVDPERRNTITLEDLGAEARETAPDGLPDGFSADHEAYREADDEAELSEGLLRVLIQVHQPRLQSTDRPSRAN